MPSAIDTHPQRKQIIDALLAGESARKISGWCKPRLSDVTIWRYKSSKLESAVKAQGGVVKALEDRGLLRPEADTDAAVEAIKDVARATLDADPIFQAAAAKRARFAQVYESDTYKTLIRSGRLDTDIENAETQALRFEAQLREVGGFNPQHQASAASHVTLVVLPQLPSAPGAQPARIEAQDVEFRALPAGDPAENPDA